MNYKEMLQQENKLKIHWQYLKEREQDLANFILGKNIFLPENLRNICLYVVALYLYVNHDKIVNSKKEIYENEQKKKPLDLKIDLFFSLIDAQNNETERLNLIHSITSQIWEHLFCKREKIEHLLDNPTSIKKMENYTLLIECISVILIKFSLENIEIKILNNLYN
jgi:hypothetical protein